MMPIWDEEWRLDGNDVYLGAVGPTLQAGYGDGLDRDRARLAAAAPAMARLLLSLEWPEPSHDSQPVVCHFCRREHPDVDEPGPDAHAPDCRWLAVMRAAGVRE
jgi:hypothetical protein